jgi:hydrogenase maturation factor
MTEEDAPIAAVMLHVESVLVDPDGARQQPAAAGAALRRGAKAALAAVQHRGLTLILFSRLERNAVRRLLQTLLPEALEGSTLVCRERLAAAAGRGNPLEIAADASRTPTGQILAVSSDEKLLRQAGAAGAPSLRWVRGTVALKRLIRMRTPLPAGKLPNDLLREFLGELAFADPSVLINPGVGEDIAAVDVASDEVLVLKSDPITFATDGIGQYAVLVNANDIATAGAAPRWLLTTLLFPVGSTAAAIRRVAGELADVCRRWGITLCGGHTEITDAVARPVVAGMMAGTVARRRLVDKKRMRTGDLVLLTKGAAVEGTAIIARERGRQLSALGMQADEIRRCTGFLSMISIIPEARIAAASRGVSAMHDVTEGGIATALEELGIAGGCEIRVDVDKIPVFPETRRVCRLLGVHPLGLIGSGSLLICSRRSAAGRLQKRLCAAGIRTACIGEVGRAGQGGIRAYRKGRPAGWRSFEVDEIARLFARQPC